MILKPGKGYGFVLDITDYKHLLQQLFCDIKKFKK